MIIWINGAYGSGKSTCAYELHRRLPDSFVYDPENVGYFIRKNIPIALHEPNFQDHTQWRSFNYDMLKYLSSTYKGIIIAPMTLIDPRYYEEIIGRLVRDGVEVHHFILYAEKETIEKRLKKRFERGTWTKDQIDKCIYAFDHTITEEKLITDNKNIDQLVEEIAQRCHLSLMKDPRNAFKKKSDRLLTTLKQIRF